MQQIRALIAVMITVVVLCLFTSTGSAQQTDNGQKTDNHAKVDYLADLGQQLEQLLGKLAQLSKQIADIQQEITALKSRISPGEPPRESDLPQTSGIATEIPTMASLDEVLKYLNSTHATIVTPVGNLKVTYGVTLNEDSRLPQDARVEMRYEPGYPMSFFDKLSDTKHSLKSDAQQQLKETLRILRNHAKFVYTVVSDVLPGKKIRGMYFDSYWRYPAISLGYETFSNLTWQNYGCKNSKDMFCFSHSETVVSDFHFTPEYDSAKFDS